MTQNNQNTSDQKKSKSSSKCQQTPLKTGATKEKSSTSKQTQEDSTTSKMSKATSGSKKTQEKSSCTVESAPQNKKKTSSDKSSTSKKRTQEKKSSKTSAQDSTGKEEDSRISWTKSLKDVSRQLWSPTKTDCVDSDLSLSSTCATKMGQVSWFSVKTMKSRKEKNSNKTLCLSLPFLQQGSMEKEATKKKIGRSKNQSPNNVKIIHVKFSKAQKRTFNRYLGIQRSVYNTCLAYIKKTKKIDKNELRKLFVQQGPGENYEMRDKGLLKMIDNHKSSFERTKEQFTKKEKKRPEKEQEQKMWSDCIQNLKFISWKDQWHNKCSIPIQPKEWKTKRGFFTPICYHGISDNKDLPQEISHGCRIVRRPYNKFFVHLPTVEIREAKTFESDIVSIDPGIKTFMTCYDPSGEIIKIGNDDIGVIGRLLHYKNKLYSKVSKTRPKKEEKVSKRKKRKHKRLVKAFNRLAEKIKNMVDDYHKKTASFLVNKYKVVIIPKLKLSQNKKLGKRLKQKASTMSFCRHVDIIESQAVKTGCKVIVPSEDYTSRTCSCCGYIDHFLGSKRVFDCKGCGRILDRDDNGAKNILLKTFLERGFSCENQESRWDLAPVSSDENVLTAKSNSSTEGML